MTLNQETEQKSNFVITSSYKTFNEKQKDLFKQLDYAEKCNKDIIPKSDVMEQDSNSNDRGSSSNQKTVTAQFNGKESIFRKPQVLPPKRSGKKRSIPDFQRNPSKWTKYSLDDVDEMSDRSNTAAAFAFLKEIEERKDAQKCDAMDTGDVSVDTNKIVFKKVVQKTELHEPQPSGAAFVNSKWQMQEYVVGRKVKKASKQKKNTVKNTSSKITLDHLNEDE